MMKNTKDAALGPMRTIKVILPKGWIENPSCILKVVRHSSYTGLFQLFTKRVSSLIISISRWVNHHAYDSLTIQLDKGVKRSRLSIIRDIQRGK